MNGTEGAKDGTLLSDGDLSSCLVTEGISVASGVSINKSYSICVRADEGEIWKFCPVFITSEDETSIKNFSIHNIYKIMSLGSSDDYIGGFFKIGDTNEIFDIDISFNGSQINSPDTSAKLMIEGEQVA
jgi:hypothetical protein